MLQWGWSEGVADGQMEGEGVFEGGHVVVAGAAGVVGGVDADAEVAADNEDADVDAKPYAGAERQIAQKGFGAQFTTRAQGIFFE